MMPAEIDDFISQYDIKYILAQFVDIHGVAKTKSVPAHCLNDVVEKGAGFAGFAVWGLGMEPHGPDFMAKGDLSTLGVVPWQPGYARIVCDGHVNDEPHPYCSRVVLKKPAAAAGGSRLDAQHRSGAGVLPLHPRAGWFSAAGG